MKEQTNREFDFTIDADEMEAAGVRSVELIEGEPRKPEIIGGLNKLQSKEYRDAYVAEHIKLGIPFQMRAMREVRDWSQTALAEKSGMRPNVISRLEGGNSGYPSMATLLQLARSFDTGLIVRFAPFSRLLNEYADLSPEKLNAVSFAEDSFKQDTADARIKELEAQLAEANRNANIVAGAMRNLVKEREQAYKDIDMARRYAEQAEARVADLEAVIKHVEWSKRAAFSDERECPVCFEWRRDGKHADDCLIGAALNPDARQEGENE